VAPEYAEQILTLERLGDEIHRAEDAPLPRVGGAPVRAMAL
jgi:hypothetical protein